jgi:hypothetical protein
VQVMQDRLAAVELMLLQKPIVSGHYTGHAYKTFLLPLDKGFRKVCVRQVLFTPCGHYRQSLPASPYMYFAHMIGLFSAFY